MKSSSASLASEPPQGRNTGFDRMLYSLYFHGAGFQHFVSRRLRPAGIALGMVFILASCLAVGQSSTSIYQLFSMTLGMFVIAFIWALIRRAKIEAKRELPRFGTAGEPLRYQVKIRNSSKRTLSRAWISDSPPDSRPMIEDFIILREPGEEERNAYDRFFAYFRWQWLQTGNRMFSGGHSTEEIHLKRGQECRFSLEMTPLRRGVIRLNDMRLQLPDPFGVFQRSRKIKSSDSLLTVLPKRFPLPPIELPGGAAFKISGEANTNSIGNSGEFVGLRDYRPGDPLRQIHWKSWAKTGKPIVKELEDTFYPRYGLVVDTLSCGRTDQPFEEVISVAASFAASLDTGESLLDLMFIRNQAHKVTAGRGVERADKLLEVLAAVTPERIENFSALSRLILRHHDDLTSCLVIFNGWDDKRAEFLKTLIHNGVICAPIIIGEGPAPAGVPGHWLESGNVARDLQRLPSKLIAMN